MRGDEEVCWESWSVKVTVAEPKTENGMSLPTFWTICFSYYFLFPSLINFFLSFFLPVPSIDTALYSMDWNETGIFISS